jgi:hypothetical protein
MSAAWHAWGDAGKVPYFLAKSRFSHGMALATTLTAAKHLESA